MSRKRISIKDLVNSRNLSPEPFTKPSILLPPSFYTSTSSSSSSRSNSSLVVQDQKYFVHSKKEYESRIEQCTSPDPLNCISPPEQPPINLPTTEKKKYNKKPVESYRPSKTPTEPRNPDLTLEKGKSKLVIKLGSSSQAVPKSTQSLKLRINLGSSLVTKPQPEVQDQPGSSLQLSLSPTSPLTSADVLPEPQSICPSIEQKNQVTCVEPNIPKELDLVSLEAVNSSLDTRQSPSPSVPCADPPQSLISIEEENFPPVPDLGFLEPTEIPPTNKQSSEVENEYIAGFAPSSRESTLSPLPSFYSTLSPELVIAQLPLIPEEEVIATSKSNSATSEETNDNKIFLRFTSPNKENTSVNNKKPPDKESQVPGIAKQELKFHNKEEVGSSPGKRFVPELTPKNTSYTRERPASLPPKPNFITSGSSISPEISRQPSLPPETSTWILNSSTSSAKRSSPILSPQSFISISPTSSIQPPAKSNTRLPCLSSKPSPTPQVLSSSPYKPFPLPPKPKIPPWRQGGSLQPVLLPIRRKSTRIALQTAGSLEELPASQVSAPTPKDKNPFTSSTASNSCLSSHQIDTSSHTSFTPLVETGSIVAAPPIKSDTPNIVPTSRNTYISRTMSSLPKRTTKRPERYRDSPEDDLESLPASAPTPIETAPTPEDTGFSDSSLTPPPASQEPTSALPPVGDSPVKEVKKKRVGRPSKSTGETDKGNSQLGEEGREKSKGQKDQDGDVSMTESSEIKMPKRRGRPPYKHLNSSTSEQITQSSSASNNEGSVSPTKLKITLNIGKISGPSIEKKELPEPGNEQSDLPTRKKAAKKGNVKNRKSESLEPAACIRVDPEPTEVRKDVPKKLKLSVKPLAGSSQSPAPAPSSKKQKQRAENQQEDGTSNIGNSMSKEVESDPVKTKSKRKLNKPTPDYSSSDTEEETVVRPKKKATRIIEDDDEDEARPRKSQKVPLSKDESEKNQDIPPSKSTSLAKTTSTTDVSETQKSGDPETISPERNGSHTKSSPAPQAKSLKKKPRPSEPSEVNQKKSLTSRGPDTPINKSDGLVRSKSITQVASSSTNDKGQGSSKKPLPIKKPAPKPAQTGTPVPAVKPSGFGAGLLGNTLAFLQGTTSTPKAKDPSKKDNNGKDVMKDTPKPIRKGGWTDEWILTPEQQREFDASKTQREAERKKREEWFKNPVNLQEAKDSYRVDSMQSRTIAVPGAMGIQTSGKPSAMIGNILGF